MAQAARLAARWAPRLRRPSNADVRCRTDLGTTPAGGPGMFVNGNPLSVPAETTENCGG